MTARDTMMLRTNEGWTDVDMGHARYLRAVTSKHETVVIAWSMTSKRVLGEGVHFDLAANNQDSHGAISEITDGAPSDESDPTIDARTPSQRLMKHANKRRFMPAKRVGDGHNSIPLDDIFAAVRVEWNEFVEALDAETLRQGFALVRPRSSRYNPALMVPMVEDIDYYTLYQRYVPTKGREYIAAWDNISDTMTKEFGIRNDDVIKGAIIVVSSEMYAPGLDGELRSKMAAAALHIAELDAMSDSISYGIYWGTHQPWVPQLGPAGAGTSKASNAPSAPPYATYHTMLQDQSQAARLAVAQKKDDREAAHEDAYKRHRAYQAGRLQKAIEDYGATAPILAARASIASEVNQRHAINPPYMNEYPMEPGDKVSGGPVPVIPPRVQETQNDIRRTIFLLLDVQPQMVTLEHSNHAANSDVAFAGQNEAIVNRQRDLEPLLASVFRFIYHIDLQGADMLTRAKSEAPEEKEQPVVSHSRSTARVITSSSSAVCLGDRVRARLCSVPLTTPAHLENMLKTHVIDHDTYRSLCLSSAQISGHLAATDKVTPDVVDTWYRQKEEPSDREVNGKAKKRSAADSKH